MTLREMERKLIESTFARCNGNRERTAQILKIGLRTTVRKTPRIRLTRHEAVQGSNVKRTPGVVIGDQAQRKAA